MTEEDDDLEFFNMMADYEPTIYEEARDWLSLHHFHSTGQGRIMFKYILDAIDQKESVERDNNMRTS
jgi:hypothetical protein